MEMCWNWFTLNNLGCQKCCYKTADINVQNFYVYFLIKNETYKTAKFNSDST